MASFPSAEQLAVERLFYRAAKLSRRGQLELHAMLTDRLDDAGVAATKQSVVIERQQFALKAMAQVADSLNLSEGQAPTTTQFNEKSRELGLDSNVPKVSRAFNGWSDAQRAFERGQVAESSRQIRQRRYLRDSGRSALDHLSALREWLDSNPDEETPADYERWREKRNSELVWHRSAAARRLASLPADLSGAHSPGHLWRRPRPGIGRYGFGPEACRAAASRRKQPAAPRFCCHVCRFGRHESSDLA
jgi:hypothetical protein